MNCLCFSLKQNKVFQLILASLKKKKLCLFYTVWSIVHLFCFLCVFVSLLGENHIAFASIIRHIHQPLHQCHKNYFFDLSKLPSVSWLWLQYQEVEAFFFSTHALAFLWSKRVCTTWNQENIPTRPKRNETETRGKHFHHWSAWRFCLKNTRCRILFS